MQRFPREVFPNLFLPDELWRIYRQQPAAALISNYFKQQI
jgi:hypothetical protein